MARVDVKIRDRGSFKLQYSSSADRSSPRDLEGALVSNDIFVFLTPTTGVDTVIFYKTFGPAPRTDTTAPFDLVGNSGASALPLQLANEFGVGFNTIQAMVVAGNDTFHVVANFVVSTGATSLQVTGVGTVPTPTISTTAGVSVHPSVVTATGRIGSVPLVTGAGTEQFLGWSGGALANDGWHDGTFPQTCAQRTSTLTAPFVLVWSSFTQASTQQMVNDWVFYSTGGRKLTGKTPVFGMPLGFNGATLANVAAGTQDSQIDAWAVTLANSGIANPYIRMGHEMNLPAGSYPWTTGNNLTLMQNYKAAYRRWALIILNRVPTARLSWNVIGDWFDPTPAYPGDDVIYDIGFDIYDGGPPPVGGEKANNTNPYTPWTNPALAWLGLWNHHADPNAAAQTGSYRWLYERTLSGAWGGAGVVKKQSISEWGSAAVLAAPYAGGGDNAYFIQKMWELIATGKFVYACYFHEAATVQGQDQNHRITEGQFPNALAAFIAGATP